MPSRRALIAMSASEQQKYVSDAHTLIVVSNGHRGYPHPMPMWFAVNEEGAYLCTTFGKSQKVLNWRRDPKATLLIESGHEYSELRGLVVYASTEIIESEDVVVDILYKINSKGRVLDKEAGQRLRATLAATASKRVGLKFMPTSQFSWDHTKLGGRY